MHKLKEIVLVEWTDSRGVSESWIELDSMKESTVCEVKSVGWLLSEKDDTADVHLVPHIGHDPDQGCGNMVIPRSAIKKITRLTNA